MIRLPVLENRNDLNIIYQVFGQGVFLKKTGSYINLMMSIFIYSQSGATMIDEILLGSGKGRLLRSWWQGSRCFLISCWLFSVIPVQTGIQHFCRHTGVCQYPVNNKHLYSFYVLVLPCTASTFFSKRRYQENLSLMSSPAGSWIYFDDQRAVHRLILDPVD